MSTSKRWTTIGGGLAVVVALKAAHGWNTHPDLGAKCTPTKASCPRNDGYQSGCGFFTYA
jgi:hypothetical protein